MQKISLKDTENAASFDSPQAVKATNESGIDSITLPRRKAHRMHVLCLCWDPLTAS